MAFADLQVTFDLAGVTSIRAIINHIREEKGVILAIGRKSHDENIVLKDQQRKFNGINWIVSLSITGDHREIDTLCRKASGYVKHVTRKTPADHDGGFDPRKKKHSVFALVYRDVGYHESRYPQDLKASVNGYLARNDQPYFYIGITSGPEENAIPAMKKRRTGDNYKDMHGINHMVAIFKSRHQDECRKEEEKLVEHFKGNVKNLNRTGGGGGRPTTKTWSFVYLGMHV